MFSTEIANFKQVARIATHTILAACGLEHSKLCARAFSSPICKHSKENQFRKSNLMSNSCHECFCSFVQSVVKSLISEKNLFQSPPCWHLILGHCFGDLDKCKSSLCTWFFFVIMYILNYYFLNTGNSNLNHYLLLLSRRQERLLPYVVYILW